MWMYSLFLLLFVSPTTISGSDCFVETLKCSRLRPIIHTHRNLFASRTQMNEMCRQQDRFFQCLDHMVASRVAGTSSLPPALQRARTLIKNFCSNASPWQKKYFELEPCINRQYTEFCTNPEFLGTVRLGEKDRSKCSLRSEAVSCITATLALNCGIEAGKLFHHLLRMTSDGDMDCYSVGSEILFLPTVQQEGDEKKIEAYHEVYSTLVKRIGSIPDDEPLEDWPGFPIGAETTSDSLEESTSSTTEYFPTGRYYRKRNESAVKSFQTVLGEVEKAFAQQNLNVNQPILVRFHSNVHFSEYMRWNGTDILDHAYCFKMEEDGKTVFKCTYTMRTFTPVCMEGGRYPQDVRTPFIPEDIDPELGAKAYPTDPYAYHFRPFAEMYDRMYKHIWGEYGSWNKGFSTTTDETVETSSSENTNDLYTGHYDKHLTDSVTAPGVHFSGTQPKNLNKGVSGNEEGNENSEYENYSSTSSSQKPLSDDLIRSYVMTATTLRPPRKDERTGGFSEPVMPSSDEMYEKFGTKHLTKEQEKLYGLVEEVDWLQEQHRYATTENMELLAFPTPYGTQITSVFTLDVRENSRLVNFTQARLNECHPNATGIYRYMYYFTPEDKESMEEAKSKSYDTNSQVSSTDKQLDADAIGISLTVEGSGRLENSDPVVTFDKTSEQSPRFPVEEIESDLGSLGNYISEESAETMAEPETEPVQDLLFEPGVLAAMSLLDSEQPPETATDDSSTDSERSTMEYSNIMQGDKYPVSETSDDIDVSESLRQNLILLKSWNELEKMIADGLENIQVE